MNAPKRPTYTPLDRVVIGLGYVVSIVVLLVPAFLIGAINALTGGFS